jgi:hypothetical protein
MSNYAYNNGVPDGPNNPSVDQPDMLINTQSIENILAEDHVSFNSNNGGLHKQSRIIAQSGIPAGTITSSGTLYTKKPGTETQLYYVPDTTTDQYQLTRTITTKFANFSTNLSYGPPPATFTQTGGWTFLPGGMLLQYGFFGKTGATGSSGQIKFPVTFTNPPYSIQMTLFRDSGRTVCVDSTIPPSTSAFNFVSDTSGSDGIYWSAIGI